MRIGGSILRTCVLEEERRECSEGALRRMHEIGTELGEEP